MLFQAELHPDDLGTRDRIRTCNLFRVKEVLYPSELLEHVASSLRPVPRLTLYMLQVAGTGVEPAPIGL